MHSPVHVEQRSAALRRESMRISLSLSLSPCGRSHALRLRPSPRSRINELEEQASTRIREQDTSLSRARRAVYFRHMLGRNTIRRDLDANRSKQVGAPRGHASKHRASHKSSRKRPSKLRPSGDESVPVARTPLRAGGPTRVEAVRRKGLHFTDRVSHPHRSYSSDRRAIPWH